jgi:crotonobetainyl-CoA:carnitine CoA-transferase CaiB-like acyl-CoA transferase
VKDDGLLTDVRVFEVGEVVAAPYAGRLLRDLGAHVLKLETIAGDPLRSRPPYVASGPGPATGALFTYLNSGKESIALDPRTDAADDSIRLLVAEADLVIIGDSRREIERWSLDICALRRVNPQLVVVRIDTVGESSLFGDVELCDLHACALAGVSWVIGEPDREPLSLPFLLADYEAGVHAASAAVAALLGVRRGLPGQDVEIAATDVLAWYTGTNAMVYEPYGLPWARAGRRASGSGGPYPYGIFGCRDGYVCLIARSRDDWDRLVDGLGRPVWAESPRYQDQLAMGRDYPGEVDALLAPILEGLSKDELWELSQRHGFPMAPVATMRDVLAHPHFIGRSNFDAVGASTPPAHLPASPFRVTV